MKRLTIAALLSGISFQAQAQQNCIEMSELQSQWTEQNITTNMIFAGQGDGGALTYIFENPDNGRWSEWIASPLNPTCVRLFDQGGGSRSGHISFTERVPTPESSL